MATRFVQRWEAVELFARAGDWHTIDYQEHVSELDAWEIDPIWEGQLRKNLPKANIKITDTYAEIAATNKRFNFVVSDNSMSLFADGRFCEHFELFPAIFRIFQSKSVLVLNVIPSADRKWKLKFPYLFDDKHCARRAVFYKTSHPEKLSFEEMLAIYKELALSSGFAVQKHIVVKRHLVYYLALFLIKIESPMGGNLNISI